MKSCKRKKPIPDHELIRRRKQSEQNRKREDLLTPKQQRKKLKQENKKQIKFLSIMRKAVYSENFSTIVEHQKELLGVETFEKFVKRCNIQHWMK